MSIGPMGFRFPAELGEAFESELAAWDAADGTDRLWNRDASLWTGGDEANWLAWLDVTERQLSDPARFPRFAAEVKARGFEDIVLLGMGGSSLCPEVLSFTFGRRAGFPRLSILDSTDPEQVLALDHRLDISKTLFFVSSKSGSTLEPNVFFAYFFDRARQELGDAAGSHFIAITDPGSKMEKAAEENGFWKTFYGEPNIGGRFSALSDFGMVPLAAMGVDVADFLLRARSMAKECRLPASQNPGVRLGVALGTAWKLGRDKLTIIAEKGIFDLGAWMEQLVAESIGKHGKAIIPVDREPLIAPESYGSDRIFAYIALEGETAFADAVAAIEAAGHPVIRITLRERMDLGQEFFRWEIATAAAGALMGINPFDQPDVEASKIETRKLTDEFEQTGELPAETARFADGGISLFCDDANAAALGLDETTSLSEALRRHLGRISAGDYFALLAYVNMNAASEAGLQQIREAVLSRNGNATCLGFGPRFLHSTGQAYKGGANNGVFVQITCDDAEDVAVPGQKYSFGVVKAAQARGDLDVLFERGRRAVRLHIAGDVGEALERIGKIASGAE
jgi:glucose-6-phosphate isomerase